MSQTHHVVTLAPLAVGALASLCTIVMHAVPLEAAVREFRREEKLGRIGVGFWSDFAIVARIISYALLAHLVEIALWATVFMLCGEFHDFGVAYYHSAVNYTTLGYGDIIMSPQWILLGPLEAADGILMFGVSTAMIFSVILRLTHQRFADLRE